MKRKSSPLQRIASLPRSFSLPLTTPYAPFGTHSSLFPASFSIALSASMMLLLPGLLVAITCCLLNNVSASSVSAQPRALLNTTVLDACKQLSPQSKVSYPLSVPYIQTVDRYMTSSSQTPTCVFIPTLPSELSSAIKLIGQKRIQFAVSSGKHASNQGFSSTLGIHISMKGFQQVTLSSDKSYADIGPGNVWDNVYQKLEGTGVNIVGGRVTGVGVGGFITGGGGFSWKTNQYGLTIDTLIHADMVLPNGDLVTASSSSLPDLFFAIKGGGNQFGIVYNFRLATNPQTDLVYGGLRTYTSDQLPGLIKAVNDFSANNTDPKAQIIPTFNTLAASTGVSLLAFYDGPDPGNSFAAFNGLRTFTDGWKQSSFGELVRSAPANATAGQRGAFHTVSLQRYSESLLQLITSQSNFYGTRLLRSATFISYDVEPFSDTYGKTAGANGGSAWPHGTSPLPLNLYFAWTSPLDDAYYKQALLDSAKLITDQAIKEGQDLSTFSLYPNYALTGTPSSQLYGSANAATLRATKAKYDPQNVMGLTTFFSF